MNTLELVPWMSKNEWEFCRDNLYGNDPSMKKKALEHLYIWKIRCPNLPIAVECTLILMDVSLRAENKAENDEMMTNTMIYESWYSVAIMRFLNLITDSEVGTKPSSTINELVKEIDIPEWIVEIRHSVAHGSVLPSITILKDAVERCLQWLYDSYWKDNVYEDILTDQSKTDNSSTFQCFEACLFTKKCMIFGVENLASISENERCKLQKVLLKNADQKIYVDFETWSLEAVHASILKKLARHLKKDTKYGKDFVTSILKTDEYLFSKKPMPNDTIDEMFLKEWCDILSVICGSTVCGYFIEELTRIVISRLEESWRQYSAAVILNEILSSIYQWKEMNKLIENAENSVQSKKKSKRKLNIIENGKKNISIPLKEVKLTAENISKILDLALHEPNQFVKIFLKHLVNLVGSGDSSVEYSELLTLIDIYWGQGSTEVKMDVSEDSILTLHELLGKPDVQAQLDEHVDENLNHENDDAMTFNEDEWDWTNTPLGILPWQSDFLPWVHIYDDE